MSAILITLTVLLILVIIVQIAKITELVSILKGEEKTEEETNKINGYLLYAFMILGLIGLFWSVAQYWDKFLPEASSIHGVWIDNMFNITLLATGIIFILTQILTFYFAYKYKSKKGQQKALFYPDNHKLEVIWTVIPAIVMTGLVAYGIYKWNKITSPAPENALVIEATGRQFNWIIRYPGKDGKLGAKKFKMIGGTNMLGQDWSDPANHDDLLPSELHMPVNKPILIKINARDVLHSFYLPHFRVKMDAVPGMPTQFWFTPTKTTEEMKRITGNPNFTYELACAELCGKGHFSMRTVVVVEDEQKYNEWLAGQKSYYESVIKIADQAADTSSAGNTTQEKQMLQIHGQNPDAGIEKVDNKNAKTDSAAALRNSQVITNQNTH